MLWSSWPPELLEKEKQQQQSRVLTEKAVAAVKESEQEHKKQNFL